MSYFFLSFFSIYSQLIDRIFIYFNSIHYIQGDYFEYHFYNNYVIPSIYGFGFNWLSNTGYFKGL